MALLIQRVANGLLPVLDTNRAPVRHDRPDKVVLGVRRGQAPSGKPPVRIFLGSERNQFRAERIFLWSVEKHRDPGRIYEIYLMKDLKGFKGRFWLTGFTNYRFAIPLFCRFEGRAIYNDTDQIYLRDPAELFDQPMLNDRGGDAGFLSINDRDTSVMLIDCERMAGAWSKEAVYASSRKQLEARARAEGLWGAMDGIWNARDKEYAPGQSACVHFTTLHTQPWRPFPDQFVYFKNPTDPLWPDLERDADTAGFMPVSATRSSRDWAEAALKLSSRTDGPELLALLGPNGNHAESTAKLDLRDILERIPDADVPWVLERLFSRSKELEITLREPWFPRGGRLRRSRHFWLQQFERASAMHPQTRWTLVRARETIHGGPLPQGMIRVLTHGKPGHNHQALALARRLAEIADRKLEITPAPWSPAQLVLYRLLRLKPPAALCKDTALIVAAGWLPTRMARLLARINHTQGIDTRLVLMGRKAGPAPDHGGMAVACRHFDLPTHPNRIDTLLPLNAGQQQQHPSDVSPWQAWLQASRRLAVLVGGDSRSHELTNSEAKHLTKAASAWAEQQDAALLVVTSRRSSARLNVLRQHLDEKALLYAWQPDDSTNPYRLALEHADTLLVTGESESMLADAVHSGQFVHIWPLPERRPGLWRRLSDAVAAKAVAPRYNRRGSIRPQQGLTYVCARAIQRQWLLPRRNIAALHENLIRAGLARLFDSANPSANPGSAGENFDELGPTAETLAHRLNLLPPSLAKGAANGVSGGCAPAGATGELASLASPPTPLLKKGGETPG